MADMTMEGGGQDRYRSGSNGEGMDLSELKDTARELAHRAREWVTGNPFAALGIAVATGFLVGRAMRMWALRP